MGNNKVEAPVEASWADDFDRAVKLLDVVVPEARNVIGIDRLRKVMEKAR
jgi:hypothetical protein